MVENVVDEDCQLLQEAEQCLVELEQFTEDLKAKKDEDNVLNASKDVTSENTQIIELQEQMQSLICTQMNNHMELMSRKDEKEKEKKSSVKLPQLDLCVFNGDKLKWTQFWMLLKQQFIQIKNCHKLKNSIIYKQKLAVKQNVQLKG